ncbi:MAG: hypothetical protein M3M99_03615, partial [Actinomycetota bacterium]|nr:hypothetical protein [Actinomycetota bacterium]
LYLFGDSPEGLEQARGIDQTIAQVPGLEGLTILEDYLEGARQRAAERPGWAGIEPMLRDAGRDLKAPTHWVESEDGRRDVMPATSEVEQREQERMMARLATAEQPTESNGSGA